MDTIGISTSNEKITKTKRIYKNLDEMSLQKNYLQTIKYALDNSDNSRSLANLLKTRGKKGAYIDLIYINLFENFITNKQSLLIFRKELTTKQKMECKQFIIYFIISTTRTKTIAISF